ncbi:uncharacterized protein LOC127722075 isoform X2 [Mytilus californianus]|uniref:uncharacterized protein LOC127722075 isoform X2 n=1 Tax=Mytilus californianus TaxID=6549 RepID=UPI00224654B9|nr:uncharacterized protein LOC127722075 isoform X2 [Mytilus californianus]
MEKGRMNIEDEGRLQSNILYLKDNVNPDDVIDHLLQNYVITFDQHGDLKSEKTASDKMDKLIKVLRFAGTNSYRKFVDCLHNSGYPHVANTLLSDTTATNVKPETITNVNDTGKYATENEENLHKVRSKYNNTNNSQKLQANSDDLNVTDGPVKPDQIASCTSAEAAAADTPEETDYDEIPSEDEHSEDLEAEYDTPQFTDSTELCLRIPFKDGKLEESSHFNYYKTYTELLSLPGWCPRINDTNHNKVVNSLKNEEFFIWYSKQKEAFIITLRTNLHQEGCIYVKVKTRTDGTDNLYRVSKENEFKSLLELFKHYFHKGLPTKFIKK